MQCHFWNPTWQNEGLVGVQLRVADEGQRGGGGGGSRGGVLGQVDAVLVATDAP